MRTHTTNSPFSAGASVEISRSRIPTTDIRYFYYNIPFVIFVYLSFLRVTELICVLISSTATVAVLIGP